MVKRRIRKKSSSEKDFLLDMKSGLVLGIKYFLSSKVLYTKY